MLLGLFRPVLEPLVLCVLLFSVLLLPKPCRRRYPESVAVLAHRPAVPGETEQPLDQDTVDGNQTE